MPKVEGSYYWPHQNIPILSPGTLTLLENANSIETKQDNSGEEYYILKINEISYEIPKFLTSKRALIFLGFTTTKIEEIWNYINDPSFPPWKPDITDGREYWFWERFKIWLDDEIDKTNEQILSNRDKSCSKFLLDSIGLTDDTQLKSLQTTETGSKPVFITLRDRDLSDIFDWVRHYLERKWSMLQLIECAIVKSPQHGNEWLFEIAKEFNENPIDKSPAYDAFWIEREKSGTT